MGLCIAFTYSILHHPYNATTWKMLSSSLFSELLWITQLRSRPKCNSLCSLTSIRNLPLTHHRTRNGCKSPSAYSDSITAVLLIKPIFIYWNQMTETNPEAKYPATLFFSVTTIISQRPLDSLEKQTRDI